MNNKNLKSKIALFLVMCFMLVACKHHALKIILEPASGSPGDMVYVKVLNAKFAKDASVSFGAEKAPIISSTDSLLVVMVPPMSPQTADVSIKSEDGTSRATFVIDNPATVRLWFSLKDKKVTFIQSQPSNEEFQQDKSYSPNKMMYEITDSKGEMLAIGYVIDPTQFEVPSEDKKGFSNVSVKGEVQFSVNVPAFKDMNKITFSFINASTKYRPEPLESVSLKNSGIK